jgi:predicted transcriptional regulator
MSASHTALSKRERQIMDALYRLGRATAAEIRQTLGGDPSDSTVRTQLRVLEEKGHVRHEEEGLRYIYLPTVHRQAASRSALNHLADTFFDGSHAGVITALLGPDGSQLSDEELDRIARLIDETRKVSR